MLQLFSTFSAIQINSVSNYFLPPEKPSINFNMDPFCEGCVPQNSSDPNSCPLSGLVEINTERVSEPMRIFLNGKTPKMSVNLDAIQKLADNVLIGNYPTELLSHPKLPYEALGAYVGGKISIENLADLLIWHQETKDYPDKNLRVVSIFTKILPIFNFEEQFSLILSDLNIFQKNILRVKLLELPVSQQVVRFMDKSAGGLFVRPEALSEEAHRVFTEVLTGHPAFAQKYQLGDFSKVQIIETEIKEGKRLRYIPMSEEVEATTIMAGVKYSHSEFSAHDRTHMDSLNRYYSPNLVNSLREVMAVLIKKTRKATKEIWEIGDFDFYKIPGAYSTNPNTALSHVLEKTLSHDDKHIVMSHVRANQERWQKDYGISYNQIF